MAIKEIEFTSHGVTCRAWLCPPESEAMRNERGAPALVMAHGTLAVREQLKHYAMGHFDIYLGEWFERSVTDQVAFLQETFALKKLISVSTATH